MDLKKRSKELKILIPTIYIAIKDERTPKISKIFGILTICYALSPIDLIPDFIPVLGYLDDLIILPVLIALSIKNIPKDVLEESKIKSKELWKNGKPKNIKYAIPVILIYILIIVWVINLLIKKYN